eukprot:scaffold34_cov260-Pinguiococcus_pyrenoidosus.AAC.3
MKVSKAFSRSCLVQREGSTCVMPPASLAAMLSIFFAPPARARRLSRSVVFPVFEAPSQFRCGRWGLGAAFALVQLTVINMAHDGHDRRSWHEHCSFRLLLQDLMT